MSHAVRTVATCAVAFGLMSFVSSAARETNASRISAPATTILDPVGLKLWQSDVEPVSTASATAPVPGSTATTSEVIPVAIKGFTYVPSTITVAAGSSVAWTNEDNAPHTATGVGAATSVLDSGPIVFGQAFTQAFETPGTYPYYCVYHPNMLGTVIVTP